jgi:hypothetical protein
VEVFQFLKEAEDQQTLSSAGKMKLGKSKTFNDQSRLTVDGAGFKTSQSKL